MRNYKSLLPSHKSQDEKRLEKIGAECLAKLDLNIIDNNPRTCDARLLKHLAYQYDVDINNLSESEARNLLSKAFLIHRYSGTYYGLKNALSNYDETLELNDNYGKPYHFKVLLKIKQGLSEDKIKDISKLINKFKNVRSVCEHIELITIHETPLKIKAVMQIKEFKEL
ncbi:phage tail protein [Campylobacter sp. RM12640]|uniref:phage tail protein n=2 Tax=unclassified Campylobacter TaxID=2593542 RepID=UPI0030155762|nr:phage tail protein [Campylobacter sp. RM12640]